VKPPRGKPWSILAQESQNAKDQEEANGKRKLGTLNSLLFLGK
jgi:hypothetical protein